MIKLAVFPLPIFLLPGGITELKIFEPRYIRLVKESGSKGFALSIFQAQQHFQSSEIAAWVNIIDFSTNAEGLLCITIQAKKLIKLSNFNVEEDGLRKADIEPLDHWPSDNSQLNLIENKQLSTTLEEIVQQYDNLKALYPNPQYDDIQWVCARFIELLPLSMEQKQQFFSPQSFHQCISFLYTLINGDNTPEKSTAPNLNSN
jgi:Lon protease-like protein